MWYDYSVTTDPSVKCPPVALGVFAALFRQVERSTDRRVMLESLDLSSEGDYVCEVTLDQSFLTVIAQGSVTVVGEWTLDVEVDLSARRWWRRIKHKISEMSCATQSSFDFQACDSHLTRIHIYISVTSSVHQYFIY